MIEIVVEKVKNGPKGYVLHTWEIDHSLPKIRLEGFQYKFNSKLISSEYFTEK